MGNSQTKSFRTNSASKKKAKINSAFCDRPPEENVINAQKSDSDDTSSHDHVLLEDKSGGNQAGVSPGYAKSSGGKPLSEKEALKRLAKKTSSLGKEDKRVKFNSWRLSAKSLLKKDARMVDYTKEGFLKLKDFDIMTTVGTGSFGRVLLARHKSTGKVCALKVIRKEVVLRRRQLEHVMNEKQILLEVDCPFIVNCMGAFQDACNLYLVLEYVNGGELFTHLREVHTFGPDKARFYASQVVLALEYLHEEKGMVYRDLKPENILLDKYGQIKLADFGFAKNVQKSRGMTWTLCGTPEYLAPEMILNKGHGREVDYWALGILIYEMLASQPPFLGTSHYDMYENILACRLTFPAHFCADTLDLLKGLLNPDRSRRLGSGKNGIQDIKDHPWFKDVDWESMKLKKYRAPFLPPVKHDFDVTQFLSYKEEPILDKPLKDASADKLFADFDAVAPPHKTFRI